MRNILLLCNNFATGKDANGICAKNIADELIEKGYKVTVITGYDSALVNCNYDIVFNYHNDANYKTFQKLCDRLMAAILFPNTKYKRAKEYLHVALRVIEEKKIDTVIAFYKPFDTLWANYQIKKTKTSNIFTVDYHMDILTNPDDENRYINWYKTIRGKHFWKKERKSIDLIVLPTSLENTFADGKILYTDFPLYIHPNRVNIDSIIRFDKEFINLTYIGSLDGYNRNPKLLLEMINTFNSQNRKKIVFHVWGKIDTKVEEMFQKYSGIVKYHGMVMNEYVYSILCESDFLVNISNTVTYNWIPSKIFGLFATNKPIINLVSNKKDYSSPYFEKYTRALSLYTYENSNLQTENFEGFINKDFDFFDDVDDSLFERSKPAYFVKLLEDYYDRSLCK